MNWKMEILYKGSGKKWVEMLTGMSRHDAKCHATRNAPNHMRSATWHPGPNRTIWKENDFCRVTLQMV